MNLRALCLFPFVFAAAAAAAAASAAALTSTAPASPPRLSPTEVTAWREDLRTLATELPRRHPLLFEQLTPTRLTQARLDSAVAALDARIPQLARHEVIVGMEQIMALVGAGHTSINPFFDPTLGFRYYPLELYDFSDGLFVIRADSAHRSLAGARVVQIGNLPADSALARVATAISHENSWFLRAYAPRYVMIPEIVGALGIAPDMERLTLTVEQGGRRHTETIAPAGRMEPVDHERPAVPHTGWFDMRPAKVAPPLWLSHTDRRWLQYLPDRRTLYVAFQSHVPSPNGEPVDAFIARMFATADSLQPERLVLDVRDDLGGNSFYNLALVQGIVRRPTLDQRGRLFAIIGRGTYSAAENLVTELERYTQVRFVGEPTGSPPAFFGDHVPVPLPNSGIHLNISSLWWQTQNPKDHRPFVPPTIYAEPTSADYRAGTDPALNAIFERGARPPLAARLRDALAAGDSALAYRLVTTERDDPASRYAGVEVWVNRLGFALFDEGQTGRAARVLAINALAFPASANVHDSLGEAFERLGRRDDAIAEYRRALAIAPAYPSSQDALRRLGAPPETGH
jgi:hypothetical protein